MTTNQKTQTRMSPKNLNRLCSLLWLFGWLGVLASVGCFCFGDQHWLIPTARIVLTVLNGTLIGVFVWAVWPKRS